MCRGPGADPRGVDCHQCGGEGHTSTECSRGQVALMDYLRDFSSRPDATGATPSDERVLADAEWAPSDERVVSLDQLNYELRPPGDEAGRPA